MTHPDDTDLQAALDASAAFAGTTPVPAPVATAALAPAPAPVVDDGSDAPAAPQFNVATLAAFKTQCTDMIKRLQDPTTNSYVELEFFHSLIRATLTGVLGDECTRYVLKDVLMPATNSVLVRTYAEDVKDMELVQRVMRALLDVIAHHHMSNLPSSLPPLPTIISLPVALLKPPTPPELTLPPILYGAGAQSGALGGTAAGGPTSSSTTAANGVAIPVAQPVYPQVTSAGEPGEKATPAIVVEGEESKTAEGVVATAATVVASADPALPSAPEGFSSSQVAAEPALTVTVDRVEEPVPSFLDIARGGCIALSPPPRTLSPSPNGASAPASSASPGPAVTSAAPPASLNNRDLDQSMMDLLEMITDQRKSFYTHYGQERPDHDPLFRIPQEIEPLSEAMTQFRDSLKVDDWCDVLLDPVKGIWKIGRICDETGVVPPVVEQPPVVADAASPAPSGDVEAQVAPASGSAAAAALPPPVPSARWSFNFEGQSGISIGSVPKCAVGRFAPLYSRVRLVQDAWRFTLKTGDLCDVSDYLGRWFTGRVLAERGGLVQVVCDGWEVCPDWLARTSERLDQYRSHAIGGRETGGILTIYHDKKYSESGDMSDTFATFRGKDWGSYYLVQLIEYFQREHGGFDLLIQRLVHKYGANGTQPSMTIPALRKMIGVFENVFIIISKSLAQRLLPLLRLAVTETILGLSDIELRGLGKDLLEDIVKGLDRVLHRIHATKDVTAFVEYFQLECAFKRFKCPIVERRINGMSFLTEYTSMVRRLYAVTWLTSQQYIQWLQQHQILQEAFGSSGHPELMRKSADMLRFITSEQRLEMTHLDLIWSALEHAMKQMDETRLSIVYKVLDDIAWNLNTTHITYLFHRVRTDIPFKEYTVGTLDLIKELTRFSHRAGPEASRHAMDLLWTIIQDESGATDEIQLHARQRLEDINTTQKTMRLQYLERCITENLSVGASIPQTLSLMQKLIDSFPESLAYHYSAEDMTRNHVIMYLNEQFHLTRHLFEDMARFKARAQQMATTHFPSQMVTTASVKNVLGMNSLVICSKSTYLKQVQDRLNFMQYLLVNSNNGTVPTAAAATAVLIPPPVVAPVTQPPPPVVAPSLINGTAPSSGPPPTADEIAAWSLHVQENGGGESSPGVGSPAAVQPPPLPEKLKVAAPAATEPTTVAAASMDSIDEDAVPALVSETSEGASSAGEVTVGAPGGPPSVPNASASPAPSETSVSSDSSSSSASASPVAPAAPPVVLPPPVAVVGLRLTTENIDSLWQFFYTDSLTMAERESYLRWLRNACVVVVPYQPPVSAYNYVPPAPPQPKSFFAQPEILAHVFNDLLLASLDPRSIELSYYLAFQQAFLALNQREATLEIKPQTPNNNYSASGGGVDTFNYLNADFTVLDFLGLKGFDALWQICLDTPRGPTSGGSTEVVNKSMEFLNKIYSPTFLSEKLLEAPATTTDEQQDTAATIRGIANVRIHYIERCISTFQKALSEKHAKSRSTDAPANPHRASRCLELLHQLLDTSENLKGLGGLRSHGTQTRGRLLRLTINHPNPSASSSLPKKIVAAAAAIAAASTPAPPASVRVYSNDTLFDLRSLLSKELLIPIDLITLCIAGKQLPAELNRMHLHELSIKNGQSVLVTRKQVQIARIDLINKEDPAKPMMPLFRAAISEVFYKYATTPNLEVTSLPMRVMSKPDMGNYILSCGAGESSADDTRLTSIFKKYAPTGWTDMDSLNVDGFCEFYRDACNDRVDNVWSDLKVHGYRGDLRKESDIIEEESKILSDPKYASENSKVLPRSLLSSHNEYFTLLFQALLDHQSETGANATADDESHSISSLTWSLLQRLPSNQDLYMNLFSLDGLGEKSAKTSAEGVVVPPIDTCDWNELLDSKNVYKLLYALQILESLTEPIQEEPETAAKPAAPQAAAAPAAVATPDADIESTTDAATSVTTDEDAAAPASPAASLSPSPSPSPAIDAAGPQTQAALSLRDQWSRKFLTSGGFQHIYRILVESHLFEEAVRDSTPTSAGEAKHAPAGVAHLSSSPLTRSLRKKCLTLLLKMLYYYLLAAMSNQTPSAAAIAMSGGGADASGLGFVTRIRSESIDLLSETEKQEEAKLLEAERQRIENENSSSLGVYGPFQNGSGPILSSTAPRAPALDSFTGSGTADSPLELKEDGDAAPRPTPSPGADDDAPPRQDLLLLGRQMSSGFSHAVLSCVDFAQLQRVLWHVITLAGENQPAATTSTVAQPPAATKAESSSSSSSSSSSTSVVLYSTPVATVAPSTVTAASAITLNDQINTDMAEPALNCLVNIMIYDASQRSAPCATPTDASLLAQFYQLIEQDKCAQFLQVLHDFGSSKLRRMFANTIYQISARVRLPQETTLTPPQQYFLTLLLQHLPTHAASTLSTADCTEYFWLLSKLLQARIKSSSSTETSSTELRAILRTLLGHLHAHVSSEVPNLAAITSNTLANPNTGDNLSALTSPKQDKILVGLLGLLNDLLGTLKEARLDIGQGEEPTDASAERKGLVWQLFFEYLFTEPLPPAPVIDPSSTTPLVLPSPPKCQTKASRVAAFNLLTTLCTESPANFKQLHRFLQAQQTAIQTRLRVSAANTLPTASATLTMLEYNPASVMIAPSGYVGLQNLGSTCYMNSLLQQFFMIPAFRYGILCALPTKLADLQASGQPAALADHLLYQLQNLFGSLSISHKQFVATGSFCKSYKDENGQPVNVRQQQDAQEFFNVLMDRIEFALKTDARFSKLIANLFEGKLVNQMICHGGCATVRETRESFMTLSLEVKGKLRMEESLRAYVEGEVLQGISCAKCGIKVDQTTKRVCLGELPPSLFMHLKRFELNFETFQHEKLNNRFEFPLEVNMEPFTKEGLARIDAEKRRATDSTVEVAAQYSLHPKEYYEYELAGIVIHQGTASSGHYISLIKERKASGNKSWFQFNDKEIRPFDISKDLDEECYGGDGPISEKSSWGMETATSERIKNAYMLVYDRKAVPQDASVATNTTAEPTSPVVPSLTDATSPPANHLIEGIPSDYLSLPLSAILPQRIQSQVLQDNVYFMEDRFIFSPDYYQFMHSVVKQGKGIVVAESRVADPASADFSLQFIQLATMFLLDTLIRSADSKVVTEFITSLSELYTGHLPACAWFIDYLCTAGNVEQTALPTEQRKPPSPQLLVDLLLNTREAYIRKAVLLLVMACLTNLLPSEKAAGLWDSSRVGEWDVSKSRIQRYFLLHHSQLMDTAPKNWVRFHEYLQFYFLFVELTGIDGRRFLLAQGVLGSLIDMFLAEESPLALADKKKKRSSMGNMVNQPSFSFLLQTVSLLARTCFQPTVTRLDKSAPGEDPIEVSLPIPPTVLADSFSVGTSPVVADAPVAVDGEAPVSEVLTPQPFRDLDFQLLTCPALYANAFGNCSEASEWLIPLACHMSFENRALSTEIVQIIINGVVKSDASNVKPFFDLMAATVAIDDSVQPYRFDKLLAPNTGVMHSLYVYRDHHSKFTFVSIKFLCRIMMETAAFARRMMEIRHNWTWIDLWLKNHSEKKPTGNSTATPARITELRLGLCAKYASVVEANGGVLDFDPPRPVMVADSKGNVTALPGGNSSSSSSSAVIARPELEGREALVSEMSLPPSVDGDNERKSEMKIDHNYFPRGVAPTRGVPSLSLSEQRSTSDDEFDADVYDSAPQPRKRDSHGLSIGLPPSNNTDPGEVEGGSGPGLVEDEGADDQSSSYQPRDTGASNGEIACPKCTYLNSSYRNSCEICMHDLKTGAPADGLD